MAHQERSKVWKYFTRINNLKAKCHLCLGYLSFKGGSISNLHLHLKRKHADHLDEQSGSLIKYCLPDPLKHIEEIEYFRNEENVKKLIELVRQRGNILYKFSKDNFWNSETQEKLWKEVAATLGHQVTHSECRQCWRNLRYLYDLYKRDKTCEMKFIDQLKFLESLYDKPKLILNHQSNKLRSRKLLSIEEIEANTDELINKNNLEILNDEILLQENDYLQDGINEESTTAKKQLFKDNALDKGEIPLSCYKTYDEMDDIDFFLGFLNKKMRLLASEEKSRVEMKFIQLVFEAEAAL